MTMYCLPFSMYGPVVIEDQMPVEVGRHVRVDRLQELQKLLTAMAPMTLADHLARRHVEGGEKGRGAVPAVVVGAPRSSA